MNITISGVAAGVLEASDVPEIPTDIARLTAGPFIGIIFNWTLLGVLIVQLCLY
jgi:hypothetical protein